MNHDHVESDHQGPRAFTWVLWCFIAVAGFFLITEHRAHLYGFLPFALLLACPLMHLFMHGGHGGHGRHGQHESEPRAGSAKEEKAP